ncbi:cell division and transport-associated protein TolQ [Plasticicumulans lactativorans]|uniref:Tol-Pal system protein TolQ n=2 Tax=Plasticicumulans lactativorans TaxID=1133106 RepID=A0A4R2L671_9GAMM|nr:protein TolQ [Plasticicumulans lactativorans]TCO81969.1 cell division and transport-associated protein TolQ [Plasticicumulans lactativorans]
MTTEMSFTHLILGASTVVQLVMLSLLLISLASWTVIFKKRIGLTQARKAADDFEDDFWSGMDLASLYTRTSRREEGTAGMEAIFLAGFQEFLRLRSQPSVDPESVVTGSQRAMRAALSRETDELELHLPVLATAASVSPYIGLFGTVWGIMNAFMALGTVKQATLQQVAPGIAEALIATAIGLFAAIPAVVAYNRYSNEVDRLVNRFDTFAEEFSNILQRQAHSLKAAKAQAESHGQA